MATDVAAQLYLGLISGTSADGIDAALLATEPAPHVRAARTVPYPDHLRRQLLELAQDPEARLSPDLFGHIDAAVGEAFATAALELLQAAGVAADDVRAIGSHGQTLRHRPDAELPFSLQVGDPARIAERTGITTVADFRRRDMAAGGQGAPLMPAFHAAVFGDPACDVAVLNLGGIANLTLLPAQGPVRGFDTGPANALMDAWMLQQHGAAFDRDGAFAASGRVHAPLLESLLDDAYFARPAPKSTGREVFHPRWLQARMQPGVDAADVQATLLELTVHTVVAALEREMPSCSRVLACGGGAGNAALMHRLAQRLGGRDLHSTAARGIDPDHVEAAGFAWLAWRTLHGLPGNLPSVTGAAGARVLGAIHPA